MLMKTQEDLQLKTTDGISTLVGLVELGNDKEMMDGINTGYVPIFAILKL